MGEPAEAFEENPEILTESMVAFPDMEPIVAVRWGEMAGQLSPDEARALGLHIIEAAEAAEHDSALVRFLVEKTKLPVEQAITIMGEQRVYRGTRR